jgi:small-conductance mechanosensitive channel
MLTLSNLTQYLDRFILPTIYALSICTGLFILRRLLLNRWTGWLRHSLKIPSICFCLAVGLYVGVSAAELPAKVTMALTRTSSILMILSLTVALGNVAAELARNSIRISGLGLGVIRSTFFVIGGLIVLSVLGISITPLLTALGVGGLAVALALKDTLENLFGGIYLISDQTLRVGDWVKLESGQEGIIDDIGWRTTKIRQGQNNLLIIPNSKLSQSTVINFSFPDKKVAVSMPVSVSLSSDPEKTERLLIEIVKKGSEDIVGLLSYPEPFIRLASNSGEGGFHFSLNFFVSEYPQQAFALHEIRKRILRKFKEEQIEFPSKEMVVFRT